MSQLSIFYQFTTPVKISFWTTSNSAREQGKWSSARSHLSLLVHSLPFISWTKIIVPQLIIPLEPEPKAPLLCLLHNTLDSSSPTLATHDSKRFQEILCGSSNETSLSIFQWEDQCSPLCLLACCQELFSLKSCLLQKLSCTTDQSMMSGCSDVMLISLGNFNCLPRAAVIYQLPPNDRRDLKWMGQLGTLLPCRTNLISCWDVIGWPSFHLVWHLV